MDFYTMQKLDKKQIESLGADLSKGNEYITETAGFIPLEVKLRRFQENGQIMQFSSSEFTSSDYRDLYLSEDLEITPEMDFEEIKEVQIRRLNFIKSLVEEKEKSKVGGFEKTANSPSDSAAATKKSVQASEPKEVPLEKA